MSLILNLNMDLNLKLTLDLKERILLAVNDKPIHESLAQVVCCPHLYQMNCGTTFILLS